MLHLDRISLNVSYEKINILHCFFYVECQTVATYSISTPISPYHKSFF